METNDLQTLVAQIAAQRPMQGKYLRGLSEQLIDDEAADCERLLQFYLLQGETVASLAEAYLMFCDDTMEETKYFIEHDDYRYHKFSEVAANVYFDESYMWKYMIGLGLSLYLWPQHRACLRFFSEAYEKYAPAGGTYLEIGPGHGKYFCDAVRMGRCSAYTAADLSETSLRMTQQLLQHFLTEEEFCQCQFQCTDVTKQAPGAGYDFITMCEVLEHVEEPLRLLGSLRSMSIRGGACVPFRTRQRAGQRSHLPVPHRRRRRRNGRSRRIRNPGKALLPYAEAHAGKGCEVQRCHLGGDVFDRKMKARNFS